MAKKEKSNKRELMGFNTDLFKDQVADMKVIADKTGFKVSQLVRMGIDMIIKQHK